MTAKYLILLALALAPAAATAQFSVGSTGYDRHRYTVAPVAGTDFLTVRDCSGPENKLRNSLGMCITLLYAHSGGAPVFHDGLIFYDGWVEGGKIKCGAIDLMGNVAVPFRYKNVREAAKSKEAKAYVMTDRMKAFIDELRRTEATRRMAAALADYRAARYTGRSSMRDNPLISSVRDGDKAAVVDCFGNYILEEKSETAFTRLTSWNRNYDDGGAEKFDSSNRWTDENQAIGLVLKNQFGAAFYNLAGRRFNKATEVTSPTFVDFLTNYVNLNMSKWYEKEEFESVEEYHTRNTPENISRAQEYFADCAHVIYSELVGRDFKLEAYDRANSSYLLSSPGGNVAVKVPFEESMNLRKNWETGKASVPYVHFTSRDDGITLSSAKLMAVSDNTPQEIYHGDPGIDYQSYTVGDLAAAPVIGVVQSPVRDESVAVRKSVADPVSDVDTDLPLARVSNPNTFALVIANEEYDRLTRVPYAAKDGRMFGEYCVKVLGLPESNLRLHTNASYATMLSALDDIARISRAYNGDIDLLVYYAGHGAPDEAGHSAHLLPVDTRGVDSRTCISLTQLYSDLGALGARSVTVFLDACFTGRTRGSDGDMLAMGERAFLEVEPRTEPLPATGSLIVFSAAGKQSAIPDDKQGHGLFTYYLLKKLKDSLGSTTYGELWDYLRDNVSRRSAVIGKNTTQIPELEISDNARDTWASKRFIP